MYKIVTTGISVDNTSTECEVMGKEKVTIGPETEIADVMAAANIDLNVDTDIQVNDVFSWMNIRARFHRCYSPSRRPRVS